jgi:hypothetical protein
MLNSRCSTASICFSNIETTALERCSIDSALGGLRYSEYPVSGSNSSHALGNNMAFRKENEDDIDYSAATWELILPVKTQRFTFVVISLTFCG